MSKFLCFSYYSWDVGAKTTNINTKAETGVPHNQSMGCKI
jgi:hypothetical protein